MSYDVDFGLVKNVLNELFTIAQSVNATTTTRSHMYNLFPCHNCVDMREYFYLSELYACETGRATTFQLPVAVEGLH